MIPSDVVSRLQLTADAAVTRVPTVQQVSDALADLVPGQRVLAEIQALLPNGAYRALVNQRDVTLALPFSAKAGDALELEVVDNDGKLTLALVSHRSGQSEGTAGSERPAVETTLSRTGNFIAGLLAKSDEGEPAKPAQLNANQPIASTPPTKGSDLVPLLKQAISQSGMFYESQQSQWVASRLPTEALLSQPQGRLSPVLMEAMAGSTSSSAQSANIGTVSPQTSVAAEKMAGAPDLPQANIAATTATDQVASRAAALSTSLVAPDLAPLVQQQLEALASQTYVWQGQAWPGQAMQWEIIEENGGQQRQGGESEPAPWQTRLTLTMPQLGEVHAALRIVAGELTLSLTAQSNAAAMQLANGGDTLRTQMEAAGLKLNGFTVGRHERPTAAE
ncbi:MAG: Flagellar hook-length control protein FliK [Pseudomonadota bacterium]|nr:Flagellar hook-length control protein FliK [Pseudomonadota bacterium]